jgi:mRNA-degrading endonuclease RelE of RelBE toxin-antitoxin system
MLINTYNSRILDGKFKKEVRRVKFGSYRIIFDIIKDKDHITMIRILKIGKRNNIYN